MKPGRDITRLIEIMAALRTPVTGCPWDIEQDFVSIAPYTIEEAYEVAEAIRLEDMDNLREELGDLLLQVVYHARMAEEAQEFDFNDVVEAITTKMIRRHPHVFGDAKARSAGMAKGMWDKIKAEEKAERAAQRQARGLPEQQKGFLDEVPAAFPALMEAEKLQRKAAKVGFDWNNASLVIEKIKEEIQELEYEISSKKLDKDRIRDELGDTLFALANLARHFEIDPENALRGTNGKFRRRFAVIEETARQTGTSLEAMSLDDMEAAWQEAKKSESLPQNSDV